MPECSIEVALHAAFEAVTGECFHDPIAYKFIQVLAAAGYEIVPTPGLDGTRISCFDNYGDIAPPAGEKIRSTQDGEMDAAPLTGQSPVGAASAFENWKRYADALGDYWAALYRSKAH